MKLGEEGREEKKSSYLKKIPKKFYDKGGATKPGIQ